MAEKIIYIPLVLLAQVVLQQASPITKNSRVAFSLSTNYNSFKANSYDIKQLKRGFMGR